MIAAIGPFADDAGVLVVILLDVLLELWP